MEVPTVHGCPSFVRSLNKGQKTTNPIANRRTENALAHFIPNRQQSLKVRRLCLTVHD